MSPRSKTAVRRTLRAFALELVIYAALVTGYFFAVLHFLGGWLVRLETQHIRVYAGVAILLIIGQAVVLEAGRPCRFRLPQGGRLPHSFFPSSPHPLDRVHSADADFA